MDTQEADSSTSQNLVFLNSHANSAYLHSCQRPAPVTDTLLRQEGIHSRELPLYYKFLVCSRLLTEASPLALAKSIY